MLIGPAAREYCDELVHLSTIARDLGRGSAWPKYTRVLTEVPARAVGGEPLIGDHQVMQVWQQPLMDELARVVALPDRDVLEVGFGLGLAANAIQEIGVRTHTIVESHPSVYEMLVRWKERWQNREIRPVKCRWQDLSQLGTFDAILFDP